MLRQALTILGSIWSNGLTVSGVGCDAHKVPISTDWGGFRLGVHVLMGRINAVEGSRDT